MYGGNDGLNTLVPYADPAYHSARPDLAYAPRQVVHLDDSFGLNPSMTGFGKLWQDGTLAIVRGVGYPQPDHSHFRSMDIWQTGSPQAPVNTGWIGRWLDATGDDPLRAVNIGAVLPPLAMGSKAAAAALPLGKHRTAPAVDHRAGRPGPARPLRHRQPRPGARAATGPTSRWTPPSPGARSERVRREHRPAVGRRLGRWPGQPGRSARTGRPLHQRPACRPGCTRSARAASTPMPTRRTPSRTRSAWSTRR